MNPTVYEIPLVSVPQQLTLTLVGIEYTLTVYWCWPISCWMFDLAVASTGTYLLQAQPLVTGADLLGQFGYLNIGGQLIVQTDNDVLAQPTFDNLGSAAHLYFVPDGQ